MKQIKNISNKAGIRTESLICINCKKILSVVKRWGKRNTKKYLCTIYCPNCTEQYPLD